ncbi:MAG: hypothetical protein AAGF23_12565, partial [Acidobacteriota bacterium]
MLILMALWIAHSAFAQAEISAIQFDSIPSATSFVAGVGPIALDGEVAVSGDASAGGMVETANGIQFADATVLSSAIQDGSASANQGLYSNTIAAFSPPLDYSEVCFKADGLQVDIHMAGESTDGGNCVPGDIGFVIERTERDQSATVPWTQARANCLMDGMRLLEPFEWLIACENATAFNVQEMAGGLGLREWASNSPKLGFA